MKVKISIFIICIALSYSAWSQVAINTVGAPPHPSAVLDISSTDKGVLLPRLTKAQRIAISSPQEGLMVYQNDGAKGIYQYSGGIWLLLPAANITFTNQTVPVIKNYSFTGGMQTFTVPPGVTQLTITARGAEGGTAIIHSPGNFIQYAPGAKGGTVIGTINVTPGEVLNIFVGGKAPTGSAAPPNGTIIAGGYNGGGSTKSEYNSIYYVPGGGGGATDVRRGGTALSNRIMVAGGGGGANQRFTSQPIAAGFGGGLVAGFGGGSIPGNGGTQSTGNALGIGGNPPGTVPAGAGGGGYYGGFAGGFFDSSGGGGSSYTINTAFNVTHFQGNIPGDGSLTIVYDSVLSTVDTLIKFNYKIDNSNLNTTVTKVTADTTFGNPIIVSNNTTTPSINIPKASSFSSGYLSSTDWNNFNNKVANTRNIVTVSPLSGGGDLTADRTISISQASGSSNGYLSSTDWTTFNSKQNVLPNASAITSGILTSNDWSTFNAKQNALPIASASASGILTATDWSTFNAKQNALPNASAAASGILTSTDWSTFNGKQNSLTVENGLNLTSGKLKLGGSLTESTNLVLTDKELNIKASAGSTTTNQVINNPMPSPTNYDIRPYGFGQSFQAGNTGVLSSMTVFLKMFVLNFLGENLNFTIYSGEGYGGTALYNGTVNVPGYTGPFPDYTPVPINITNLNIPIIANNMYTIKFFYSPTPCHIGIASGSSTPGNYFDVNGTAIPSQDLAMFTFETNTSEILTIKGSSREIVMPQFSGSGSRPLIVGANGTLSAGSTASATSSGLLSAADWTTFNNKQAALPNATSTTSGILTSSDWSAFNSKFNLPALNSGSVLFSNGSSIAQKNNMFYWDNTNNALGIGTNTPSAGLNIHGYGWNNGFRISQAGSGGVGPAVYLDGDRDFAIISTSTGAGAGDNKFNIYDATADASRMVIDQTGAVGIGQSSPTSKLDVNGTAGLKVSSNHNGAGYTDWIAANIGGQAGKRVVIGVFDTIATIGAHNNLLNEWKNIAINPTAIGNVGIGNTNPQYKLDVTGNQRIDGNLIADSINVTGNIHATGIVRQNVHSHTFSIPAFQEEQYTYNHNLGYEPVFMTSIEQTGGIGYGIYINVSYENISPNQTIFYIRNSNSGVNSGKLKIIVVN